MGWGVAALVLGILGSGLFKVLDHAIFWLDANEIEDLARARPRQWGALERLRADFGRTWLTLQCGETFFNLVLAVSTAWLVLRLSDGQLTGVAGLLCVLCAVCGVLFLGDILPGILVGRWLGELAPLSARIVQVLVWALWPLYAAPMGLMRLWGKVWESSLQDSDRVLEVEKRLLTLIGVGEVDVALEEDEREMIDHALEFGDRCACDVMTSRAEVFGFDDSLEQGEVLDLMRNAPYSRVLVYRRSLDDLVGVLHAKHVLLDPATDYRQLVAPPLFVPEDMDLVELTALMRKRRSQLVVVLDAYGATAGVVSMNDILEAIVGPDVHGSDEGNGDRPVGDEPVGQRRQAS